MAPLGKLVELTGFEPALTWLQTSRSAIRATAPQLSLERLTGLEPIPSAWKAVMLANYTKDALV